MQYSDVQTSLTRRKLLAAFAVIAFGPRSVAAASVPSSIAATDWAAAESLLTLGIVPVAIPDTAVYRQWMETIALPETVGDLGSRAEPNFEMLAALSPDRILISNWQAGLAPQFARIAPVQTVTIIDPPSSPLDNARQALVDIGRLVSRETEALSVLAGFHERLRSAGRHMRATQKREVIVGVLHENGRQIYAYGPGSWVHDIIVSLGLDNALGTPTSRFGNALIDIATLADRPTARLFYLDQGERTRRAEEALAHSTVWNRLPIVRAGRVKPIPVFYPLGGIPSAMRFTELLVQAVTANGEPG